MGIGPEAPLLPQLRSVKTESEPERGPERTISPVSGAVSSLGLPAALPDGLAERPAPLPIVSAPGMCYNSWRGRQARLATEIA